MTTYQRVTGGGVGRWVHGRRARRLANKLHVASWTCTCPFPPMERRHAGPKLVCSFLIAAGLHSTTILPKKGASRRGILNLNLRDGERQHGVSVRYSFIRLLLDYGCSAVTLGPEYVTIVFTLTLRIRVTFCDSPYRALSWIPSAASLLQEICKPALVCLSASRPACLLCTCPPGGSKVVWRGAVGVYADKGEIMVTGQGRRLIGSSTLENKYSPPPRSRDE